MNTTAIIICIGCVGVIALIALLGRWASENIDEANGTDERLALEVKAHAERAECDRLAEEFRKKEYGPLK
jgi:hypothetical protein